MLSLLDSMVKHTQHFRHVLDLPGETTVRASSADSAASYHLVSYVEQIFEQPRDYPPLSSATVPGDRVALAIHPRIPQVEQVVEGTLSALRRAGVQERNIHVLLSGDRRVSENEISSLRQAVGPDVALNVHNAHDSVQLALLGITDAQRSLRLNRILCDADVVVPIGLEAGDFDCGSPYGALFPQFSDAQTIHRFSQPCSSQDRRHRRELEHEISECDWMLGLGLSLLVVPGPQDGVREVLCGTPAAIRAESIACYTETWGSQTEASGNLVLAVLGQQRSRHTWQEVARALNLALHCVEPGGAIALCAQLSESPGKSLRRLFEATDLAAAELKLQRDGYADTWAALTLCRALQQGPVYLLSGLDPALVERLGITSVTDYQELTNLARVYGRCLILEDAEFLLPPQTG